MRVIVSVVLCLTLGVSACASAGGGGGSRSNSNILTPEDFAAPELAALSAFEAIVRLRPRWAQQRTGALPSVNNDFYPTVVLDGIRGGFDMLRSLPASSVARVRFLSGPDATMLYGTGYTTGVIEVDTL
jgi:hypothetical protein